MDLNLLLAIAPIFLLIVLGHALRRGGIPSIEFWNLNDKLVYWVLFPCLLFHKIATIDLPVAEIGNLATVVYAGFGAAVAFALLSGAVFRLDRPLWSSLLQACARHNTFIALAFAERFFPPEETGHALLVSALLIPITNITVVTLMVIILRRPGGTSVARAIVRDLSRNPLLIAVACGAAFNAAGIRDVPVLFDMTSILGSAALPIVLLCVGANIRVRAMVLSVPPTLLSMLGKFVVFPGAIIATGLALELDPFLITTALLFGAAPCGPAAFSLARGMGGDAPAVAAMVTLQTAASFFTMSLTLYLAAMAFGH